MKQYVILSVISPESPHPLDPYSITLDFCPLAGSWTGKAIAEAILAILVDFGIAHKVARASSI